ncbi:hypothetical protein [Allocoleopsis sp.]|uniref:hypothetical protein n=1 Tax=Allocoleopsis sp. TaxID=3088169 RepID=UPI002FD69697
MIEDFIPDATETPTIPVTPSASSESTSNREPVKILVIGSPKGVNNIIQTLYRLRFAEVREWSPLQPTANPGEVVSILKRQLSIR